jgi:AraC-like DNA-binding protein
VCESIGAPDRCQNIRARTAREIGVIGFGGGYMDQFQTVSTSGVVPGQRIEFWKDISSSVFSPPASTPGLADHAVHRARTTGSPVQIAEVYSEPRILRHTRAQVCQAQTRVHFLHLQLEGESVNRQDQREARLVPGDLTICDNSRPYEIVFEKPNRMLVFSFSDKLMRRYVQYPQSISAVRIPGTSGMGGLLSDFLKSVWQRSLHDREFDVNSGVADTMLGLLANTFRQNAGSTIGHSTLGTAHRARIVNYIEVRLGDPQLTPTRIAATFRITTRYLHHLFSEQKETVARYILRRRLEECARALTSPSRRNRTITNIAFDNGFSSATHFGRVFRLRYGMTPREYRSRNDVNA